MNTIRPAANLTADTNRAPSPDIWANCPWHEINDPRTRTLGWKRYDDFSKLALLTTPTITTEALYSNGYKAFGSSGGTLVPAGIELGSGLVFTETDDDEGLGLATIALPFKIDRGKGAFWFECRLKTNTITDTRHGFFLGLLDSATLSATVPIAAAGTLADENFVGFHRLETDGDQLDTVYKANTVTQVSVKTDALSSAVGTSALEADTFIKLGMTFNPFTYEFAWYVNGYKLPDTKTIPTGDGDDFPNDVQMGFVFALLCASGDDAVCTLDWWCGAQLAA